MATFPYFFLGPTALVGIVGLLRGPDPTEPTPAEDWQQATVDVIIPAYNSEDEIELCIASLVKQTKQPRNIILIDDGSLDHTAQFAEDISQRLGLDNILVLQRNTNLGKTPSIQMYAYGGDADVEFILDSDTILISENYIERTVQELYKGVGIASACGKIIPMREVDRTNIRKDSVVGDGLNSHYNTYPQSDYIQTASRFTRIARYITNIYRDVLYKFLQGFIYHAEMTFFGSIINPVGCAVAYRRKYIKDLFEDAKDELGINLTTSEDIYLGFGLVNEGYRNIQLQDVKACTLEPTVHRLPQQVYLWSSAFFQSCYYFKSLPATPFKILKNIFKGFGEKLSLKKRRKQRKIQEAYRQPFGKKYTRAYGRPIGWFIFTSLFEKICFPTVLLLFVIFGFWHALLLTYVVETLFASLILFFTSKGERLKMFFKSILVSPIRYSLLFYDLFVFIRFIIDITFGKNELWRK